MEAIAPHRRLAGRYVLQEHIATGGMATVWTALDEVLARTVAVKMLREDLARDPVFFQRFQAEAVAAARLTHPNIIAIYDTGVDEGVAYIVMEYFAGPTLRAILDERGFVEPEPAVGYLLPVLSALGFAHAAGVLHRDIKPANILVADDARVKVADFGLAKAAFDRHDLTQTGVVLGTVRYLSPEQVQGDTFDARSDLYATGVVLYELLTGRPPFAAESDVGTAMMRLTRDPTPPSAIRPGIPRSLEAVVLKAMARRPDERFQSADAMRAALERHAAHRDATAPHVIPAQAQAPEPRRGSVFRSWMLVPVLVVAVAALVIGIGLLAGWLEPGGPLGVTRSTGGGNAPRTRTIDVTAARDFDPGGDDRSENPELAAAAVDGNPGTAWTTEHYERVDLGGLKPGVGLWIDFGRDVDVDAVTIASGLPGWRFELKASMDAGGEPLRGDGGSTFTMPAAGRVTVELGGVRTDGVLIWITQLAPDEGGFAAAISEVTVTGSAG